MRRKRVAGAVGLGWMAPPRSRPRNGAPTKRDVVGVPRLGGRSNGRWRLASYRRPTCFGAVVERHPPTRALGPEPTRLHPVPHVSPPPRGPAAVSPVTPRRRYSSSSSVCPSPWAGRRRRPSPAWTGGHRGTGGGTVRGRCPRCARLPGKERPGYTYSRGVPEVPPGPCRRLRPTSWAADKERERDGGRQTTQGVHR